MPLDAWLTTAVVLVVLVLLARTRIGPDLILMAALTFLIVLGVLSPEDAISGFSSTGLATVGVLYVVASGVMETGLVYGVAERLLGRPRSERLAQLRLMLPVSAVSAFLNNTPVVAMLVPVVQDWARRNRIAASRLMIPLSYAAIFGGTCTLIGTSTNLIVAGLVADDATLAPVGFFDIAWLGLPSLLLGTAFILVAGRWLLPNRQSTNPETTSPKEYSVEMVVEPGSPLVGRSIEQAGLRHLPGLFLAEIERNELILPAVAPSEQLLAEDRLVFVGNVASVADLYKIRGLNPAPDQIFKLQGPRRDRMLVEAVVAPDSPFLGKTIREAQFRTRYQAVVIAVTRGGRRLPGKVGDIVLSLSDVLLLETRSTFVEQYRHSRDFLLLSPLNDESPPRHERAGIAAAILIGMVVLAAVAGVPMLVAALIAAGLMLATRCTSASKARRNIDWQVLITIGAAIGLGQALELSGAASSIAEAWIGFAGQNPWMALLAVYLLTSVFTEVITNNAVAVLMFSIAKATALGLGVSFSPFVFAIMMAASASFATPIGYQTNLMVYGTGGYRFSDFLRIGIPLNILMALVTVAVAPLVWPF